jgi:hypothetical protein
MIWGLIFKLINQLKDTERMAKALRSRVYCHLHTQITATLAHRGNFERRDDTTPSTS